MTKDTGRKGGQTKTCVRCGKEKSLECFRKDAYLHDGLSAKCRRCLSKNKNKYSWPEDYDPPAYTRWTEALILEEARRYDNKRKFQIDCLPAYTAAVRHTKGLDFFCAHMTKTQEKWTFEKIQKEALKYDTKLSFREENLAAYTAACRTGRLDEICAHMKRKTRRADRYIYIIESFDRSTAYVGLSYNPKRRYNQHKNNGRDCVKKLIEGEHSFTIMGGPLSEKEAQRQERATIRRLIKSGVNLLNGNAGGVLGGNFEKEWTREEVQAEALKYDNIVDFKKGSGGAYRAASRMGGVRSFCAHMPDRRPIKWTPESVAKEALKYSLRTQFERAHGRAVALARRWGIMDEICSHMPVYRERGTSNNDNSMRGEA